MNCCGNDNQEEEEMQIFWPFFVDPPDDVFAPYFEEFQSKRAPNFTAVEDLILCKAYAAVSEDPTIGTDQTVETF